MKRRIVNFMLAAAVLIFAVLFTGCLFMSDLAGNGGETETTGGTSGGSQSGGSQTKPQEEKKEGGVGDIIKTEDWDISLVYVKEYDEITGKYSPELPSEGKKFLVFFMECKYKLEDRSYLYSSNFDAYVDGLAINKPDYIFNEPDDWEKGSLGVNYNKRMRITLIYEAPTEWQKAELVYKGNMFLSTVDAKFTLNREETAADDFVYSGSPFGEYVFDEQKITPFGTVVETKIWKIKLLNAKEYTELKYSSAEEGKKFAVFFFEIENISDESKHFNTYDFYFYQDGYSVMKDTHFGDVDGYDDLSGDVISGAKRRGYVVIEVDESYKNIEIYYDDLLDDGACFAVNAETIRADAEKEEE